MLCWLLICCIYILKNLWKLLGSYLYYQGSDILLKTESKYCVKTLYLKTSTTHVNPTSISTSPEITAYIVQYFEHAAS